MGPGATTRDDFVGCDVGGPLQRPLGFVVRYWRVDILGSANRHGIDPSDVEHALRHALVVEEVREDPLRYLVLGPDAAGNMLELVVMDRPQGPAVIHAMRMQAKYERLLGRGKASR